MLPRHNKRKKESDQATNVQSLTIIQKDVTSKRVTMLRERLRTSHSPIRSGNMSNKFQIFIGRSDRTTNNNDSEISRLDLRLAQMGGKKGALLCGFPLHSKLGNFPGPVRKCASAIRRLTYISNYRAKRTGTV